MSVEDHLAMLAGMPAHPGLTTIEAGVFARIESETRARRQGRHVMLAAVGVASLAGMAGAAIPSNQTAGATGFAPLALAPSTLLGGGE